MTPLLVGMLILVVATLLINYRVLRTNHKIVKACNEVVRTAKLLYDASVPTTPSVDKDAKDRVIEVQVVLRDQNGLPILKHVLLKEKGRVKAALQ